MHYCGFNRLATSAGVGIGEDRLCCTVLRVAGSAVHAAGAGAPPSNRSVRPNRIVADTLLLDQNARFTEALEQFAIEEWIAKLAAEALDAAVLRWPAWLDQDVTNPVGLRPSVIY